MLALAEGARYLVLKPLSTWQEIAEEAGEGRLKVGLVYVPIRPVPEFQGAYGVGITERNLTAITALETSYRAETWPWGSLKHKNPRLALKSWLALTHRDDLRAVGRMVEKIRETGRKPVVVGYLETPPQNFFRYNITPVVQPTEELFGELGIRTIGEFLRRIQTRGFAGVALDTQNSSFLFKPSILAPLQASGKLRLVRISLGRNDTESALDPDNACLKAILSQDSNTQIYEKLKMLHDAGYTGPIEIVAPSLQVASAQGLHGPLTPKALSSIYAPIVHHVNATLLHR